eukprot:scaffold1516_cov53-Attheya_sp.AAC.1
MNVLHTSCETKRNAVGNNNIPVQNLAYKATVPAYGQQQQLPMAEMNPPGRRRPVHGWHPTRVPQPSQIIDELHAHYQKQTEEDIKYPRNTKTPSTTTTTTTSPTHHDEQQPSIMAHVNPRPARTPTTLRFHMVRTKRVAIPSQIIDDLHAHYHKITENDSKYLWNATTTMTASSPMRYNDLQARLAKSEDNNKTYATLRESTITKQQSVNDPDDQYQKKNGIQCKLDTTSISTTTSTSPTRYNVQDIDKHTKQYIANPSTSSKHTRMHAPIPSDHPRSPSPTPPSRPKPRQPTPQHSDLQRT